MSRTMPAALAAAHAASPRRGAECVIIVAKDGSRAGFTTWDRPLELDLGFGGGLELCSPGFNLSALTLASGLDASSFEMDGPAVGEFSGVKVRGGKWRSADVWLVRVSPGITVFAPLMYGKVAEARLEGRRWIMEIRNRADAFNQSWGRVLSPWCTATFGDEQCTVPRTPSACTVTAVVDDFRFTVSLGGAHPNDYFNLGTAGFLTGELGGTAEARIAGYSASGTLELFESLIATPQIGDTLNLFRGCSQLMRSDDPSLPTCVGYGNGVNNRGWPEVPSSRLYHNVSAPGTSYA